MSRIRRKSTWYERALNRLFRLRYILPLCFGFLIAVQPFSVTDGMLKKLPSHPEIKLPLAFGTHGIDISHHNGIIDWGSLEKETDYPSSPKFCFIKATEGTDLKDPRFKSNWENAKKIGLITGAYHFFNPESDPGLQALNFILTAKLQKGDLPPVIDFEHNLKGARNRGLLSKRLRIFHDALYEHYGVPPIIYTNLSMYREYLQKDYLGNPIWISLYQADSVRGVNEEHLHFWQYSPSGKIKGINGEVDLNVYMGEEEEFQKLLLK